MSDEITNQPAAGISKEQVKKILKADLANMVKKVANGKTLTATERALLTGISDGNGPEEAAPVYAKKMSELATILGFKDRKTIQRWSKDPGAPKKRDDGRYVVAEWKAFAKTKGHSCDDDEQDGTSQTKAKAKNILLQNEKLEIQIGVLKGDFVRAADVETEVVALITQAKTVLLAGPASLAPQVVGVSIPEAELIIKQWLHTALSKLQKNPLGKEGA